jgi:hypothetical protein
MNPKQARLAYVLFFSCFAVWLVLIPSISFLSDGETTSAVFPSQFILALFIVSAVLSAVPAMLIGLHFLGIDVRIRKDRLRSIPTSPEYYIKEIEEDHSKFESVCKDWSLSEQTAVTEQGTVGLEGNLKGKVRSKEEKKAFFLFGETKFNGCTFKLGYLKGLPKNKPIPDECFGCPQILECVALSENK